MQNYGKSTLTTIIAAIRNGHFTSIVAVRLLATNVSYGRVPAN
jgi:hypothetical protein